MPYSTFQKPVMWRDTLTRLLWVNLVFVLLAIFANFFLARWPLLIAHSIAFIALTLILISTYKFKIEQIQQTYLAVMWVYFFSFFWVGDAQTYDVLWLTLFPAMAAFVLEEQRQLLGWHLSFIFGLVAVMGLTIIAPDHIEYTPLIVSNLIFATSFISLIAWFNFRFKLQLQQAQIGFQKQLESRVEQATNTISKLNDQLEASQRDVVLRLGEICEVRSKETGQHVQRVSEYSRYLAQLAGLDEKDIDIIHDAAPLHDVGKVAIEDSILNKPGKYNEYEYSIMRQHAQIGYDLLSTSKQPLLQAAATIARDHHEWWNGQGYPNQTSGEQIHIYGRIVAIADVFDALSFERVYKPAWEDARIRDFFEQQKGVQFDPVLSELFLQNFDRFTALRNQYR
ncbi:HD-GYP domain-containing protein [Thiomicrospira pelophila]|uniref:HD-GYP domain-containing protein n=1 Tax=Thiomicrospira pelophila TaxID=934 RepID=UPI000689E228|nr:HD domain-containing phosphohydrolase [Thiomicrospira pelophila]